MWGQTLHPGSIHSPTGPVVSQPPVQVQVGLGRLDTELEQAATLSGCFIFCHSQVSLKHFSVLWSSEREMLVTLFACLAFKPTACETHCAPRPVLSG